MLGVGIVDGQLLANSLMSLKGNDLKMVYILLLQDKYGPTVNIKNKRFVFKRKY